MFRLCDIVCFGTTLYATALAQQHGPSDAATSFVASPGFPTSIWSSYYEDPVATQQPQPILYDPVLKSTFPVCTDVYSDDSH